MEPDAPTSTAERADRAAELALIAGASSFMDYPLSPRDQSWDAADALVRWREACGIGTDAADWERFHTGFFWADTSDRDAGDVASTHRLPFVDVIDGETIAVWSGITTSAASLDVPDDASEAVKASIANYYDKASIEYGDAEIVPPWEVTTTLTVTTSDTTNLSLEGENAIVPDELQTTELPPEMAPRDERPDRNPTAEVVTPAPSTNASQLRWEATLLVEGKMTEDGRYIEPGATSWRELPLTLMALIETDEGHKGAEVAGRIDKIWKEGNIVKGSGIFDDSEFGHEIARMVTDRVLRGNSVDLAVLKFEVAYRDEFDESGARKPEGERDQGTEEPDMLDAMFGADLVMVFTDCVIGMSTVCPFPAFADAEISLVASGGFVWQFRQQSDMRVYLTAGATIEEASDPIVITDAEVTIREIEHEPEVITASAAGLVPVQPPAEWFRDPELDDLTPLTITDEGRVFGHAAAWDTCHIGIQDVCTVAPRSLTNYAYFHLGEIELAGGERLACGKVTLGTGHAAKHLGRAAAAAHYDDTGTAVIDLVTGEDEFGIWVAGALRPDLDASRVRELRASVLSGDWRNVNGHLELVALLAVNVPGFPVPRARALVASGEEGPRVLALVAAGIHDGNRPELTEQQRSMLEALSARAEGGLDALAALALGEAA